MLRWSIQLHKWIALIVGIQVLFWVAGGVVITAIPIERVRSEHHVAEAKPSPLAVDAAMSVAEVARRAGLRPVEAQMRMTPRGPVWSLKPASGDPVILSAITGKPMAAMAAADARVLAQGAYKGDGMTVSATLLAEATQETGKTGPIWRVDFDDAEGTSFYLSPQTGEVVSRRSNVWRFYDFFWGLHIMDLEKGENFNHPPIIAAGVLTLSIVVTGFILLWIRLARDLKMLRMARAGR